MRFVTVSFNVNMLTKFYKKMWTSFPNIIKHGLTPSGSPLRQICRKVPAFIGIQPAIQIEPVRRGEKRSHDVPRDIDGKTKGHQRHRWALAWAADLGCSAMDPVADGSRRETRQPPWRVPEGNQRWTDERERRRSPWRAPWRTLAAAGRSGQHRQTERDEGVVSLWRAPWRKHVRD